MSSVAESHFLDRLREARVDLEPFPHCVVDQVFPEDFFFDLHEHWPDDDVLTPLAETGRVYGMRERLALILDDAGLAKLRDLDRRFWQEQVLAWLMSTAACRAMAAKFDAITAPRLEAAGGRFWGDALIVSDRENYAIGPHTDAPHRLVSALFYLPVDEWTFAERVGTVLYRPKDARMTCVGGPQYGFDAFQPVRRIAFLPNRMLLFPKTTTSFHGVERVSIPGIDRRLLIFNVRIPV